MIDRLIEARREADSIFVAFDERQLRRKGGQGDFTDLPAFELATMLDAAVQATALYRGLDHQPVAIAPKKGAAQSPILLGADIIAFHHEIWPDVPMPG